MLLNIYIKFTTRDFILYKIENNDYKYNYSFEE